MKIYSRALMMVLLAMATLVTSANSLAAEERWYDVLAQDQVQFYTDVDRGIRMASWFAAGGIMANSDIDEELFEWYVDDVQSSGTDDASEFVREIGDWKYAIPATLLLGVGTHYLEGEGGPYWLMEPA